MTNNYESLQKIFSGAEHSKLYAAYRPSLSQEVFETIIAHCSSRAEKKTSSSTSHPSDSAPPPSQPQTAVNYHGSLALDIGCGPGNSSLPLTKYFDKVIGVDVSEEQISRAPTDVPGLSFRVGQGENLSFVQSGSVDLIFLACAIHWLDLDKFYPEVDRILKPGGTLASAVYCYTTVSVDHPGVHSYLSHITNEVIKDYWAPGLHHFIVTDFKDFRAPYGPWIRNEEIVLEKEWTIEEIAGFLHSCSAVQAYNKQHPEENLANTALEKMREILCQQDGVSDKNRVFKVRFPLLLMLASKPEGRT